MSVFRFKQFTLKQAESAMKVGTDAMLLGSLIEAERPNRILDIGTGTGVLALMMAQRFKSAHITGVELDIASAHESQYNFDNALWSNRLKVVQGDFLEYTVDSKFDLIISNPPYFQSRLENKDVRKAQARHESALPMELMLKKVAKLIEPNGSFWLIVPSEVADLWIKTSASYSFYLTDVKRIHGKEDGTVKRVVLAFRFVPGGPSRPFKIKNSELCIRNSEGNYTKEYIEVTKAFHFNDLSKNGNSV